MILPIGTLYVSDDHTSLYMLVDYDYYLNDREIMGYIFKKFHGDANWLDTWNPLIGTNISGTLYPPMEHNVT